MRRSRCAVIFVWLVAALAYDPARAESPSGGDGSQTGDGSTKITGLAQTPEANLFVGSSTTAIPFIVPPGRKNLTPQLALAYNSGGGPSPYGYGWDLPLPRIQRSTKHGVLSCNDDYGIGGPAQAILANTHWDDFVLTLPGASIECTRDAQNRCIPRIEESFVKIVYQAGNTWRAWDKSGTRYEFGAANVATDSTAADPTSFTLAARTGSDTTSIFAELPDPNGQSVERCTYTFAWYLSAIVDPNGNRVDLRYRLLNGMLYPHTIRYGSNSDASHPFEVRYLWVDRAADDQPRNSLGGFTSMLTKRLDQVVVKSQGSTVRTYDLDYEATYPQPDGRRGRQSFLESVRVLDPSGHALQRADNEDAAGVFVYERVNPGFSATVQEPLKPSFRGPSGGTMPNALRWRDSGGHTQRDVFDINGDGFADIVDAWPEANCTLNCTWDVYLGSRDGFATSATAWYLPNPAEMHVIRGADSKKTTIDMNGDGIADFLVTLAGTNYWVV